MCKFEQQIWRVKGGTLSPGISGTLSPIYSTQKFNIKN